MGGFGDLEWGGVGPGGRDGMGWLLYDQFKGLLQWTDLKFLDADYNGPSLKSIFKDESTVTYF